MLLGLIKINKAFPRLNLQVPGITWLFERTPKRDQALVHWDVCYGGVEGPPALPSSSLLDFSLSLIFWSGYIMCCLQLMTLPFSTAPAWWLNIYSRGSLTVHLPAMVLPHNKLWARPQKVFSTKATRKVQLYWSNTGVAPWERVSVKGSCSGYSKPKVCVCVSFWQMRM